MQVLRLDTLLWRGMTDYINHAVMRKVKRAAKDSGVSVIYPRRSWSAIYKKLQRRAAFVQ
jgi:hypothetical protein